MTKPDPQQKCKACGRPMGDDVGLPLYSKGKIAGWVHFQANYCESKNVR